MASFRSSVGGATGARRGPGGGGVACEGMTRRIVAPLVAVSFVALLGGCTDDDGDEPGLERIDGPAQVDEERLEQQTPDDGTSRGG